MENGHICVATFLDVVSCCARLAISFTASHNTIQKCCKMFSVEMVRAFDQAFNDRERQGFLSLSRDLTSAMRCKFSFV